MKRIAITMGIAAAGLAACGTPTPTLRIGFSGSAVQTCPSTDCKLIDLKCDAVMCVRMVDPEDSTQVIFSQCERVQPDRTHDMCPLRGFALEQTPIPVRELDVQVAVYLPSQVSTDPMSQELICPSSIDFSANGFPVEEPSAPALGGHAYYHPGDATVDVILGCNDLRAINATCTVPVTSSVAATVVDFDTRLQVTVGPEGVADHLWVSVGEPHNVDGAYVLNPIDTVPLRFDGGASPRWSAPISVDFGKYACVEVLEDVARTTASLRCTQTMAGPLPDLSGVRISRDTLDALVKSLSLPGIPPEGLTIGMVVDRLSNGVQGSSVASTAGTVTYPTTNGLGGTQTSSSGIFLSRDAPFGTKFSAATSARSAVGGLVAGKVTIVIVPLTDQ